AADAEEPAVPAGLERLLVQHVDLDLAAGLLDDRAHRLGEGGGREVAGRGVDPVADQRDCADHRCDGLDGLGDGLGLGGVAEHDPLGRGGRGGARLVAGEGVAAEAVALEDCAYVLRVGGGQGQPDRTGVGDGASGGSGSGADAGGVDPVGRAQPDQHEQRALEGARGRDLRDLAGLAARAEGRQQWAEGLAVGVGDPLAAGGDARSPAVVDQARDDDVDADLLRIGLANGVAGHGRSRLLGRTTRIGGRLRQHSTHRSAGPIVDAMATDTSEPHRSPLHARHTDLGAKLAPFGGWEMPLEYAGVVAEHKAVRSAAGLFDVSHLGKVVVTGPGAAAYVNATLTNDLDRITTGQAQYTLCCDQGTGGIVDDLIVYLLAEDHLLLVPNAANSAEVVRRLQEAAPAGVEVRDEHHDHAILAVQGPASDTVLVGAGFPTGHDYMSFTRAKIGRAHV